MNSSESRNNLHFPSIIGESKNDLDNIIRNIDSHYNEWIEEKIDKKTGQFKTYLDGTIKKRVIRPSKKRLKGIQSKIKDRILSKIELPDNVHGGVKKKSNITNAKQHQGNKYQFATDLKDFYPSIKSKIIHDTFVKLGYNKQFAFYMTKLTTWKGELPQGTPTSTHLSNIIFLETDYKLIKICNENNITYTRYIDDLTFSSQKDIQEFIPVFLNIIKDSGVKISHRKTEYKGNQNITGINIFLNKIDAPEKIILKAEEENIAEKKIKPYNSYLSNIRKTNKRKKN
ncbi:reverse transcriptase family protein [Flavobacterium nitrogenifigens]|uniref:RNA-directed DNA polymerase n=1 Tax=Flavobacterium nitrogenifigens TaxID=1617283 RepID=A0A521B6C0_9FLAO|nr:reverse transcriptase family protein [Flavobacterium nitrogenifigens]KAF2334559.1 RNA-directed DNA polymerase [Flavobacterium nitrogenifigens]SMO42561.1 RNA-directed DNA polymerase [Flavobacterium nitrogenifigens]